MKKKAALYDPYLDVLGGGEKHILSILQVIEQNGFEASVFWNKDLGELIKTKLNLNFTDLHFRPNIFQSSSFLKKLSELKTYDILLYVTDGSYFFSSAKKNVIFCMVPNKKLYSLNPLNRMKMINAKFISNSFYTHKWLSKWSIQSQIIYPYVSDDLLSIDLGRKKERIILSVGRFFGHLHSKKHSFIVDTFNKFQKKEPEFKLILVGGLKKEDETYFNDLKTITLNNKNIVLEPNLSYTKLLEHYRKAMFFWHFTGFGTDENKQPERVEHLGMTPLEAMAAGSIPFCFNAGGPRELIKEGHNGYLFNTQNEVIQKTNALIFDEQKYKTMQKNGKNFVSKHFSYELFKTRVEKILL
ncbi:hypothetical protein A2334_04115 [Candidatus Roizmanbacteria bacterium RIFOXYB2_FULL_38_10]|uniref:Glycosyl transferase family 1 domain-containing protein n=1 Tax=Candidatus Roizmanbacteria bacterium RIFOXYD1_FULL_38_12 TaxID=1802093 RepID=A0A1F7KZB2_9BACT|nr:MAG: hypothetical protein A3K47_00225 [Candidatus Roizmanbacteria bacterium RIFOXYA2_FULL_38_14]OGK63227.1 MAG: hypothetical protein A3K27_00225 [Candidatus Roizmanbacteria bacterium RIFOXYA1_FULL_37_12]OGK65073.1 MAG: hypothetical protein A3K38_00225 [Candidatus Roizmanbacteria bacterium RIFOXYB1_FULL_40_23]OGK68627.1 MAG: hypothetical protein A2334_04115 [Candidatus Roizmanbacteria bacterium RIFOXYB2_FULL_38_10]OGK69477.1 MAG: hypothetical protein A3K21_00225 [Candidatus Roizmanbacteria ba